MSRRLPSCFGLILRTCPGCRRCLCYDTTMELKLQTCSNLDQIKKTKKFSKFPKFSHWIRKLRQGPHGRCSRQSRSWRRPATRSPAVRLRLLARVPLNDEPQPYTWRIRNSSWALEAGALHGREHLRVEAAVDLEGGHLAVLAEEHRLGCRKASAGFAKLPFRPQALPIGIVVYLTYLIL